MGASVFSERLPKTNSLFLLQRYAIHTSLSLSPYLRLFAELKSGWENGRATGPRPQIDVDRLDLHQAFIDANIFPGKTSSFTLRAGRQELSYGANRLLSENEGPNVRLAFEGVKLLLKISAVKFDAFYTRPVDNASGVFDNKVDKTKRLYGIYTTIALPKKLQTLIDIYIIGFTNKRAVFIRGAGAENRGCFGLRLYSKIPAKLTYDFEGTYQNGRFTHYPIQAFSIVARANYNFPQTNHLKTISLVGQVASGDNGKSKLNTFNPLYARVYYGVATPYWPSNIMQMTASADMRLTPRVTASADIRFLWRENKNDGLYLVMPTRLPNSFNTNTPSNDRFIGAQRDIIVMYYLTKYWYLGAEFTFLPTTAYIRDSGHGTDILFAMLQTKFLF